ncbi:MAG: phosphatidylinositol mannoside acyltransferase [Acidimicrobiia bacterium]|nr:phosphatidylinositol mannoside acyltransferase [Acidimicrobiia bacterium]
MADAVTPAYQLAARVARWLPPPAAAAGARVLGRAAGHLARQRRAQVRRNLLRIDPSLSEARLRHLTNHTFESYARYFEESFRLPGMAPAAINAGFVPDGWERLDRALEQGNGAIMAMPHLGGWEWGGFWITQVRQRRVTAVVERLEPPALFDWFVELRQALGFEVVALGPEAGAATARALKANHTLALLCDRDLAGTGPEVEFFGERTTLPGGPATLALRTGAALLPTAIYFDGPHSRRSVVLPPLDTTRQGKFRQDVQRVTQDLAHGLEDLIRRAPEQWHLLQPNWPSDQAR